MLELSRDPAATMKNLSICERRALQLAEGMGKRIDNTGNCCESDTLQCRQIVEPSNAVLDGHLQILCLVRSRFPSTRATAAATAAISAVGAVFRVVRDVVVS